MRSGALRLSVATFLGAVGMLVSTGSTAGAVSTPAFQLDPNPPCPIGNSNAINRVGDACVNEGSMLGGTAAWGQITDGSVSWDYPNTSSPQWAGTYSWEAPGSVPIGVPADISFTITGEEKTHNPGASFCPAMATGQDFTANPAGLYQVCAQSGMKASVVKTVELTPKKSSGKLILWVGIEDGPNFYYQYDFREPPPPPKKKLHTTIHYDFSGHSYKPKTTLPFYDVGIKGQGSFDFVGPARTSEASGENSQGKVVLSLYRKGVSRATTVQLKPTGEDYFRTVEPNRTISYTIRIRYQVISSALGCLPVGSQTVLLVRHHRDDPDVINFGFCGVHYAYYERHSQSVSLSQSESRF